MNKHHWYSIGLMGVGITMWCAGWYIVVRTIKETK